jgi:hypothetical protein
MTVKTFLVKRRAKYVGEVGLFPSHEMAADDLALTSDGTEVLVKISSPKKLQQLKIAWALAQLVADNSDGRFDKDDAMNDLCKRAKFTKELEDPKTGKIEERRKSMEKLSEQAMQQLLNRFRFVTVSQIIPGLPDGTLREELLKMVSR